MPRRLFLLATFLVACQTDEEDTGPDPPDTVPTTILETSLTLDSTRREGILRVVALDRDGPVGIYCGEPFDEPGSDSLVLVRPYATLRYYERPIVRTVCLISQGHTTLSRTLTTTVPNAMDKLPEISRMPIPTFHAGIATPWPHSFTDDWGLTTVQLYVSADTTAPCAVPMFVEDTTAIAGTSFDTTLVITIPEAGLHCVAVGTKDDVGHHVVLTEMIEAVP